ncbi:MAG: hypothetical protein ACC662_03515, partial [Planctomycetota bacterium]
AGRPLSAIPISERRWSGCGLPSDDGISMWHARILGGRAFYSGIDKPEDCGYLGADFGRTFCGGWGLDAFYRRNSGQAPRLGDFRLNKDGGYMNHVGAKLTWQRSFGRSRFYGWLGAGPEYFWTEEYLANDTGWGFLAEVGIGYVLSKNWRILLGLEFHGDKTSAGRLEAKDDGTSRWLWTWVPILGVEFDW